MSENVITESKSGRWSVRKDSQRIVRAGKKVSMFDGIRSCGRIIIASIHKDEIEGETGAADEMAIMSKR